jgi:hypothetical protein
MSIIEDIREGIRERILGEKIEKEKERAKRGKVFIRVRGAKNLAKYYWRKGDISLDVSGYDEKLQKYTHMDVKITVNDEAIFYNEEVVWVSFYLSFKNANLNLSEFEIVLPVVTHIEYEGYVSYETHRYTEGLSITIYGGDK